MLDSLNKPSAFFEIAEKRDEIIFKASLYILTKGLTHFEQKSIFRYRKSR